MRVLRTILGMLLLTVGLPALLVGGGLWFAMQHRDAGGAFTGKLQRITSDGYAVVVRDADALLERDAPFVRADDTRLRITAQTRYGPAFVAIAPTDQVARYLDQIPYLRVDGVDLGTGALPVHGHPVVAGGALITTPARQPFWLAAGTGSLDWSPARMRDRQYSLVIMNPNGRSGVTLTATAEIRPGWLNTATWGLLVLGTLFVMLGMVVLAWPGRRRDVVYVVEPGQVPELAHRIGVPLPLTTHADRRILRPRTLADAPALMPAQTGAEVPAGVLDLVVTGAPVVTAGSWPQTTRSPVLPSLTWPPAQPAADAPHGDTALLAPAPAPASARAVGSADVVSAGGVSAGGDSGSDAHASGDSTEFRRSGSSRTAFQRGFGKAGRGAKREAVRKAEAAAKAELAGKADASRPAEPSGKAGARVTTDAATKADVVGKADADLGSKVGTAGAVDVVEKPGVSVQRSGSAAPGSAGATAPSADECIPSASDADKALPGKAYAEKESAGAVSPNTAGVSGDRKVAGKAEGTDSADGTVPARPAPPRPRPVQPAPGQPRPAQPKPAEPVPAATGPGTAGGGESAADSTDDNRLTSGDALSGGNAAAAGGAAGNNGGEVKTGGEPTSGDAKAGGDAKTAGGDAKAGGDARTSGQAKGRGATAGGATIGGATIGGGASTGGGSRTGTTGGAGTAVKGVPAQTEHSRSIAADRGVGDRSGDDQVVPSARSSELARDGAAGAAQSTSAALQAAAELLPARSSRRRKTAGGLPADAKDPEPIVKVTRPGRRGLQARPKD